MLKEYKIEWTYRDDNGKHIRQVDIFLCYTPREAIIELREEYCDLTDIRIEDVWEERENSWVHIQREEWEVA